jgi:ethanolamine utilization protein EutQ
VLVEIGPPAAAQAIKEESTVTAASVGIRLFSPEDVDAWYRPRHRKIFLGDVLDPSNSESMSVGFARYAPGESNEWVVTYDEVLIVTKGAFTVRSVDGIERTARAGEVIFLRTGTPVVYSAKEEGADVVYVTYPHWIDAQRESEHAGFLEAFHPVDGPPARSNDAGATDAVELMQRIFRPLERGESDDFQAFYDVLADDVEHTLSVGELRGKRAVVAYFEGGSETIEFRPFEKPLDYYGRGGRAVIVGDETFKVKETGVTHRAEWAWVVDVRDGLITRIVEIQHLSEAVAEVIRAIVSKAQSGRAQAASEGGALLGTVQPSGEHRESGDTIALIRSIYDQQERGEPEGFQRFQDALAADVVFTTPVGEVRGKQAVIRYFASAATTLEFDIFVRPLEYFGDASRVVQVGGETFRVKQTGSTHEADWAWVFDVEHGRITRILAIQDLSGVADEVAEALAKAQKEAGTDAAPAA